MAYSQDALGCFLSEMAQAQQRMTEVLEQLLQKQTTLSEQLQTVVELIGEPYRGHSRPIEPQPLPPDYCICPDEGPSYPHFCQGCCPCHRKMIQTNWWAQPVWEGERPIPMRRRFLPDE